MYSLMPRFRLGFVWDWPNIWERGLWSGLADRGCLGLQSGIHTSTAFTQGH